MAMCRELADRHRAALAHDSNDASNLPKRPLRAYLLLRSWQDNPLAARLEARYPQSRTETRAVPDEHFDGHEGKAPCVIPLPDELWHSTPGGTLSEVLAREWLAAWLQQAWQEVRQRLVRQHFGAILFSRASAREIAHHLVNLGHQTPPHETQARLLHYQDPRVMQRAWPLFTPWQRKLWMGPVSQWWSLAQPWGPWDSAETAQDAGSTAPAWFKALPDALPDALQPDTRITVRRLFTAAQWERARLSRAGNRVWRRHADAAVAPREQPSGALMTELLHAGLDLGLTDQNLEDFAWCSSHPRYLAENQQSIPWHAPRWAPLLERVLTTVRNEPDATFGGVFHDLALPTEKANA